MRAAARRPDRVSDLHPSTRSAEGGCEGELRWKPEHPGCRGLGVRRSDAAKVRPTAHHALSAPIGIRLLSQIVP